jgi:hypothetical protein
MRETNWSRPQDNASAPTAWASILSVFLVIGVLPALGTESDRPPRASTSTPRPVAAIRMASATPGVRVLEHISYGTQAPQAQVLNAYLVQRPTPTAATIQILSGGWNSAPPQRANLQPFRSYFDAGISVIVVAHRPIGKDVHWPAPGAQHYSLGAKFEPPAGRVVHGMGQWEQYNAKLLPLLPAELRPASKLIFITIGDTPRGWRPEGIRTLMQRHDQEGFIPHLDIAPRGNQPSHAALVALADPLFGIDHEVASTSRFDGRIQDLARVVKEFGKPVIVRIGGEFNGRWNGYHPYAYPKAFRKIVGMFREAKAGNAAFVWCYEPAAPGDFDERNEAGEYKWFPGDDVIDWFSIDWFNRNDFTGPLTGGRPGANTMTAHGRSRKFLDMAVAHQKPVMIAESAPCRYDLSDPAQAEAAWREWFEPYFALLAQHSEIEWFHLISYDWTRATYFAQTGWKNNDFTANPALLEKLVAELRKPQYLHANDKALLKDYTRFRAMSTENPEEGGSGE